LSVELKGNCGFSLQPMRVIYTQFVSHLTLNLDGVGHIDKFLSNGLLIEQIDGLGDIVNG
jgi:hypothetical protein